MTIRTMSSLENSFERVFKTNYLPLFYCAFHITQEEEASKDIVSEAFTALWENSPQKVNDEHIVSYLYKVVRSRSIDYVRHEAVKNDFRNRASHLATFSDDEFLQQREKDLVLLESSLGELPSQTQRVFNECYLKEHSYKQTAEILGISVSSVHKHIVKGFASLRKKIIPRGDQNK